MLPLREQQKRVDEVFEDQCWGDFFSQNHSILKSTRQRGSEVANHLSAIGYLKKLEEEMELIRKQLDEAWVWVDSSHRYAKCIHHMDRAQQRMHQVIKKLGKRKVKSKVE
jgi:nitric oxide synthase oxygenase domain/subunit